MLKRLTALALAMLVTTPAFGQVTINNLPSGTTPSGSEFVAVWQNGHTVKLTTSQIGLGGTAGGDLSGSYPNPSVVKIAGQTPATIALTGNAGDLIAGTIPSARLPLGTTSQVGGFTVDGVTIAAPGGTLTVIGGGGGGSPPGGSSGQAQYNAAGAFGGISGFTSDGTKGIFAPNALQLTGATAGAVTLNAPATGGGTLALPGGSDTLAGISLGQVLTNKTISGASNTLSNIANASLTNSSMTLAGHVVALGGTQTLASSDLVDSASLVTLNAAQTLTNKILTAPTMTTPALGTPASGVATNLTGLPISTGVSGLGANVAAFLATASSANLATAITDETGTAGSLVFSVSPALTGSPTAPTQTLTDNSTKIATTAFVLGQNYAAGGTGAIVNASNVTALTADFNTNCKILTVIGASKTITLPLSTGLLTGGCLAISTPLTSSVTIAPATGDAINGGTVNASVTFPAGYFAYVTTDAAGNMYIPLPSGGGGSGFPITLGSTSIPASSTTTSISGLTLVAPALGTPSALVLTNATGTPSAIGLANGTGLPISTGVSGLATGAATFLGTSTSANLRALLTDEVGTGAAYFVGGALGTPASGTATNFTGLPLNTGVTGTLPIANGGTNCGAGAVSCLTAVGALTGTPSSTTYLRGDGTWSTPSGGGSPGGSNTQFQFNSSGSFGGLSTLTTDGSAVTDTASAAASTPAITLTGAGYSGGSATTNTPLFYINAGSAPSTWGTGAGGTLFGINAASAFAGNFADFHLNGGASLFKVDSAGLVTSAGGFSGSGASLTGVPISTGISGLATGVATFLGTPSSANLAAAITDETGTGAAVFAGGPTLTGTTTVANLTSATSGAASTPAWTMTGTPYSAGSATTNFPLFGILTAGATAPTTWATGGTMFGINAPSGFTGNLIDMHTNGGGNIFNVGATGTAFLNSTLTIGSTATLTMSGRSKIGSSSDGLMTMQNNAGSGFTRLDFGGTSSSFPGVTRNGVGMDMQLADGSAATWVSMSYLKESVLTVATLPASPAAGWRAYVSDAVTCVFGSTPTGSGSTGCPVVYNGSAWVGG